MGCVNQRATGLAALVAAASVLVVACGGPDEPAPTTSSRPAESATLKRITDRGKIIIGLRADTPGLAHRDPVSGAFDGFEVELGKLVAAGLGLKPDQITFTQLTSDTGLPSVAAGTVDIFLGGATKAQVGPAGLLAAGPYLTAGLGLLYRKSGPTVTDAASAAGRKVCTVSNSPEQAMARDAKITDPGKLVGSTSVRDCVDELGLRRRGRGRRLPAGGERLRLGRPRQPVCVGAGGPETRGLRHRSAGWGFRPQGPSHAHRPHRRHRRHLATRLRPALGTAGPKPAPPQIPS